MSVLNSIRIPSIGIKLIRILPDGEVHVQMVQCQDQDGSFFQFVSPREDHIPQGGPARLIRGVVASLHFLDEFVEFREVVNLLGGDVGFVGDVVVD